MKENIDIFEGIAGFEDEKTELLMIRDWILDPSKRNDPAVTLPRGILLYGDPGNGKSLFLHKYSKSFGFPVIEINGSSDEIVKEVNDAFDAADKNDFTIVVVDEIDLLIAKNPIVERMFQNKLDGVSKKGNVLVLATTNNIHALDEALLRNGRMDRIINIHKPNRQSRKELFDLYLNKLNLSPTIDTDYLAKISCGVNGSDVSCIVNDVYLRKGKNVTTLDVEESYYRIDRRELTNTKSFSKSEANLYTAYHECAHAILCYKYSNNYTFYRASFNRNNSGAVTRFFPVNENNETYKSMIQNLEIGLGGYVISKFYFHDYDEGAMHDLQEVRDIAVRLVNKMGVTSSSDVLPWYNKSSRMETEHKRMGNEKKIARIITKSEKHVKCYLKNHLKQIKALANIMMEKGFIDANDMNLVMNNI